MTNQTAPGAHRHPFWVAGWNPSRTSDVPILNLMDHLNDWLLYVQLKNPPPQSTVTYVVEDK